MVIIYHHAIVNEDYHEDKIPYKGKIFQTGKSLKFQVEDLPVMLQKILWVYLDGDKYQ